MPLMIIGTACRPRAFKKKTGQELGFDYWDKKKAWMNCMLFFDWLKRFNSFIARTHDRKVVLLLDNSRAHGNAASIPELSNVEILLLPPNTTAKVQPMDAGIIACLKRGYRKWQYKMAIDNLNANVCKIYKVDQLFEMKVVKAMWQDVSARVIQNCWNSTGLTSNDTDDAVAEVQDEDVDGLLETLMPAPSRMSLAEISNVESNDIFEMDDMQSLKETVVRSVAQCETTVDSGDDTDEQEALPGFGGQKSCIDVTMRLILEEDEPDFAVLKCLRRLRGNINHQERRTRQTTLDSFFCKQ